MYGWQRIRQSPLAHAAPRLIALALILAVVIVFLRERDDGSPPDRLASIERLVATFDQQVFGNSSDQKPEPFLNRADNKIRALVLGKDFPKWYPMIKSHFRTLSEITGINYFMTYNENDEYDILIYLLDHTELMRFAERYGPDDAVKMEKIRDANCLSSFSAEGGRIAWAAAFIATDLGTDLTVSCTLHELVHLLGFRYHNDLIQPSILNIRDRPIEPPINDRIMLRTLYDTRLRPGMTRDEAMPIAREIITELVAGATDESNDGRD